VLNHLTNGAIAAAGADPGESTLAVLRHYLDPAQAMGFTDIESRILNAMDTLVRAVAQEGYEKCQQGQHGEGRAILGWALDLAHEGIVSDPAFAEQLETWLNSCGDAVVTLTCNRTSVYDISLTAADTTAFAFFEVTVESFGGEPMDGLEVWVQKYMPAEDRWRAFGGGTSDVEGKVKTFFIYGRVPEQWEPEGMGRFIAYARSGDERTYSDTLDVELVRRRFTMDYSYSMDYYKHEVDRTVESSGSAHAEGTWWIGYDMNECNPVTRIYSSESRDPSCIETWTLLDDAGLRSCFFNVNTREQNVLIDGMQVPLKVLQYVNVIYTYPTYPATMHIREVCGSTTIRDEIVTDLYVFVGGLRDELWPEPEDFPLFEYVQGEGFEPYTFGGLTSDGNGRSVLSIEITATE
jgi:hypothetical protein